MCILNVYILYFLHVYILSILHIYILCIWHIYIMYNLHIYITYILLIYILSIISFISSLLHILFKKCLVLSPLPPMITRWNITTIYLSSNPLIPPLSLLISFSLIHISPPPLPPLPLLPPSISPPPPPLYINPPSSSMVKQSCTWWWAHTPTRKVTVPRCVRWRKGRRLSTYSLRKRWLEPSQVTLRLNSSEPTLSGERWVCVCVYVCVCVCVTLCVCVCMSFS